MCHSVCKSSTVCIQIGLTIAFTDFDATIFAGSDTSRPPEEAKTSVRQPFSNHRRTAELSIAYCFLDPNNAVRCLPHAAHTAAHATRRGDTVFRHQPRDQPTMPCPRIAASGLTLLLRRTRRSSTCYDAAMGKAHGHSSPGLCRHRTTCPSPWYTPPWYTPRWYTNPWYTNPWYTHPWYTHRTTASNEDSCDWHATRGWRRAGANKHNQASCPRTARCTRSRGCDDTSSIEGTIRSAVRPAVSIRKHVGTIRLFSTF